MRGRDSLQRLPRTWLNRDSYPSPEGDLTHFKRWRLSDPRPDDRKYHQEHGTKVYVYYPPFFFRKNGETATRFRLLPDTIFVAKGEFKTLSLLEYGVWAIGIPSFTVYSAVRSAARSAPASRIEGPSSSIPTVAVLGSGSSASCAKIIAGRAIPSPPGPFS